MLNVYNILRKSVFIKNEYVVTKTSWEPWMGGMTFGQSSSDSKHGTRVSVGHGNRLCTKVMKLKKVSNLTISST